MPRTLTAGMEAERDGAKVLQITFVELDFPSGFQRLHSWIGDITHDGNTYQGVAEYGGISSLHEGSDLAANGISLSLSGVSASELALILGTQYTGRRARAWFGFLNSTTYALIDAPAGPWKYMMDASSLILGPPHTVTLNCESDSARWQREQLARFTMEDHQRLWGDDLFFEHVPSVEDAEIIWPDGLENAPWR